MREGKIRRPVIGIQLSTYRKPTKFQGYGSNRAEEYNWGYYIYIVFFFVYNGENIPT